MTQPALGAATREAAAKHARAAAAEQEQHSAPIKVPPLKPLTTTEIRVILGAIPPSHAAQQASDAGLKGSSFDAYA